MLFELLQALSSLDTVQRITIYALPVIFAITVHEAAHGYVARYFGDMTAEAAGRISFNPLRHIDPIGTLLIPGLTLLVGGILFGWAKPVPVNFGRLRHPKRDMLWVAAAGPGSNFIMAIFWALAIKVSPLLPAFVSTPLALMGTAGIMINVVLMVLNLLPLPPLDGGRIAVSLLPHRLAWQFAKVEPYGFIILLVLMFTHVLGAILWPFIMTVLQLISWLFF
ncbi:peptidase M50 [Novimethylophilus kurashikiensis]|uniref:Peptidase M50 n=1 Tax=Novimethylophilus kurashikiensis TaxID=1825523 RepID=A0A2R5FBN4_9PROT|nr:site-2 protease family protein [Novimethylophilus kurashikiensis]GBG15239.1 peptidase M50 [Novimethylophilus kurashikiensis]